MIDQKMLDKEKEVIDAICLIFDQQGSFLTNLQVIGILEALKFFFMFMSCSKENKGKENEGADDEHQ